MTRQSRDIEIIKKIDAYLKNQLSEEEAEAFWVELMKNPKYLEYLETEMTIKSIMHERNTSNDAGTSKVEGNGALTSWKWLAAAASVIVLVVAVNFFRMESTTAGQQAVGSINMTSELEAPMVTRSQKADLVGSDSLMNRGFQAALSGEVETALKIYQNVVAQYGNEPVAARAHLNIGIIKYNDELYNEATESFEQALNKVKSDKLLEEKAYWYLGNSYINQDQLEKAREAVYQAYTFGGAYRKPAYRLLRKLDYQLGNVDYQDINQEETDME